MFPALASVIPIQPAWRMAAQSAATARIDHNRGLSQTTHHYGGKVTREIEGLLGEFALLTYFGLDWQLALRNKADGGYDLKINGTKIDVKATRWQSGGLILLREKQAGRTSEIYVLAIVTPGAVRLAGWTFAGELHNRSNIRDLGYTREYYGKQDGLYGMPDLFAELKARRRETA